MKKISIVLAVIVSLTLAAGCASSGGGGASSGGSTAKAADLKPYVVDLKTLPLVKNEKPFTGMYNPLIILLPEFPVDITQYTRVTITAKYFDEKGAEIEQHDTKAMVTMVYDPASKDWGPEMGPGGNAPLKEFNVGGYSGLINTDKGVRVRFTKAPGAVILQNSALDVKYIELTSLVFHTGSASGAAK